VLIESCIDQNLGQPQLQRRVHRQIHAEREPDHHGPERAPVLEQLRQQLPDGELGAAALAGHELRIARNRQPRIDALEDVRRGLRFPGAVHQILQRLRQNGRKDCRNRQRRSAADPQRALPAPRLQHRIRHFARRQLSERQPAIDEGDRRRPPFLGEIFAGQRNTRGQGAAEPDPCEQPQHEQLPTVARERRHPGEQPEQHNAPDRHALVAVITRQRRHEEIADQKPDLVGRQNPAQHVARDVPILRDLRRDISDHLRVEAVDEQDQHAEHADGDLQPADAASIDDGIGVEDVGHQMIPPGRT